MNLELLQNKDVLTRLLILFVPTAIAFLVSVIYLFVSEKNEEYVRSDSEDSKSAVGLFLPICLTNFMYSIMEVLSVLVNEKAAGRITETSISIFIVISVLGAGSCLIKGIIGGLKLSDCTGAEKQNGLSKAILYMAAAEVPGLISLAIYFLKLIV